VSGVAGVGLKRNVLRRKNYLTLEKKTDKTTRIKER